MADNLQPIQKLFDGYKGIAASVMNEFESNFLRLKSGYHQLIDDWRSENMSRAEEFNIFNILGVAHYEVTTHSAFLRELLDSHGTHGQGNLFFVSFLSMLSSLGIILKDDITSYSRQFFDDYTCIAEQPLETGRVDIMLSRLNGDFPFCIIVENKVWAGEQEKQIERYWQVLEKMELPEESKKILYLTPLGTAPSKWSIAEVLRKDLEKRGILHCISYRNDIKSWLQNIVDEVKSTKVQSTIAAYIEILDSMEGQQ